MIEERKILEIRAERLPEQGLTEKDISFLFGADAALFCPVGMIAQWSGKVSDIPISWVLCDGQNGTPDLKDKFIKSINIEEEPGIIGGSAIHTHDNHSVLEHTEITIADHPIQSHSGTRVVDHPPTKTSQADKGATQRGINKSTLTLKTHLHTIPVLPHSVIQPNQHPILPHSITQPYQHPIQTHSKANNEPLFYKLAFIIKI